ncbi:SusC/RagA family TonB-linked outer membrane protein [Chitinophaga cymbidii]|uniref:SusC/RagA family TonB-linked outer membrane protein n=1 Tax=Chitinophaga cymbidii TaxID=1096750 RepID=A0A512REF8_9BACT|nr:SusC/RagA family TonB-linked outer membrane protein [Chitinophaga cymbidii]GEP94014.1 SusC/RagA family TonB-linked outer membrane protein [Chitinophaga cymbidii]
MEQLCLKWSMLPVLLLLMMASPIRLHSQSPAAPDSIPPETDSLRQVLFVPQQQHRLVQSTSEIRTPQLEKTTSASFGGLLAGHLAGLYATQSTGEPGNDLYSLLLRGQTPFVLVDGTPQQINYINPEQIESITLLKDALATAMLGMRGARGALNITTKRGVKGKQQISFKAMAGIQQAIRQPEFLNAYDFARLYNEALANDGKAPVYSAEALDAYRTQSDPSRYPDVNWQNEILKPQTSFQRYDLTVSGGGDAARYFVNLDYLDQEGMFKTASFNKYNTNADYKRYTFRSNVEMDLHKMLTANINVFGQIHNMNQPGATTESIFSNFLATPNNAYPMLNSDGSLGGNSDYANNIYGQSVLSGYRPSTSTDFKADLALKGNLDNVVKGLWIRGTASYKTFLTETINRSKALVVYQKISEPGHEDVYQQFGTTGDQSNSGSISFREMQFYTELALGYTRQINEHGLEVLVLANNDHRRFGNELPQYFRGLSGRISYNFRGKYLAELAAGYNGTNRYPSGSRYGLFPAVGASWVISKESFLSRQAAWLDDLRLSVSYGKTGNALDAGYFAYNQYYASGGSYNFGNTQTAAPGIVEGDIANPYLTWEKADKFNAGISGALFSNRLSFNVEYFSNKFYDLLQTRGASAAMAGMTFPMENLGINRYTGVDLQLLYQGGKGSFTYFVAPNVSLLQSKVVFSDEVFRPYGWMERTGMPVGQRFGYIAEGLYQSDAEIGSSPQPAGYTPVPGDIRYKDLNGDNIINEFDQAAIGTTKPMMYYGITIGAGWKGFDISALLQGVENRDLLLTGNGQWEFQSAGRSQAYAHHLGRWTPGTAATATYPRLSIGANPNNHQTSSYWIKSGDYARLKNLEVGYTLPSHLVRRVRVGSVRVFFNATNLFTLTSLEGVDPEASNLALYPIQKVLNAGIHIKL